MSVWGDIRKRADGKSIRKEDAIDMSIVSMRFGGTLDPNVSPFPNKEAGEIYVLSEDCQFGTKGQIIVKTDKGFQVIGTPIDTVPSAMIHI